MLRQFVKPDTEVDDLAPKRTDSGTVQKKKKLHGNAIPGGNIQNNPSIKRSDLQHRENKPEASREAIIPIHV